MHGLLGNRLYFDPIIQSVTYTYILLTYISNEEKTVAFFVEILSFVIIIDVLIMKRKNKICLTGDQ